MLTRPKLMLPLQTAWLIAHLRANVGRPSAPSLPRRPCRSRRSRCAAHRRIMQRPEHPGLPERVVTAEEELALAADRVADVLEFEPVGVHRIEIDPLNASLAPELDARRDAVPRVVEEDRALAADRFQLVALRHRGAA